jgi:hypothetical protein
LVPGLVPANEKGKFKKDIIVTCPEPNQCVSSPLMVTGKARGPWYFEASFPRRLQDAQGNELAVGNGKASGAWMTENFVPFAGTREFAVTKQTNCKLILENDNTLGCRKTPRK